MHHRVAQIELAEVFDQGFDVADLLLLLAPSRARAGRKQLGLGDEINAGLEPGKAGGQTRGGQAQALLAGQKFAQRIKAGRAQPVGPQQVEQAGFAAFALSQHQHPVLGVAQVRFESGQRILRTAQHREFTKRLKLREVGLLIVERAQ